MYKKCILIASVKKTINGAWQMDSSVYRMWNPSVSMGLAGQQL